MYVTNCRKCLGLHLPSHCKGHVRRLRMARTDFRYEKRPEPENVQAKANIRQQKLTLKPPLRPVLPSLERRFSVSPLTAWLGMPSFSTWGHQTQWCGVTAVTYDMNHLNQGEHSQNYSNRGTCSGSPRFVMECSMYESGREMGTKLMLRYLHTQLKSKSHPNGPKSTNGCEVNPMTTKNTTIRNCLEKFHMGIYTSFYPITV